MRRSLDELRQAAHLVENAAFNLAESVPSNLVADLMMAAAQIERLTGQICPGTSKSH